ncbi:OmpA family protein [Aliiroseovarius sp. YM-037]|uniref:OmpA family protein n=1 Tax=Aliiroseovarius sp. YM-037 TaxID=3341728 RepID=UPI003A7FEAC7
MQKTIKSILAIAGVATLAGCAPGTFGQFYRESGSVIDRGNFGNASMNNMMIQTGQRGYAIELGNRFANEVPTMVNFAFDSTVLDASARATLDRQAAWIRQFPEIQFRVFGHTDLVGSNAYNRNLGLRRAQTVVRYLVSRGVSGSRLQAVSSLGETQPLIPTQNRERRNRRTVTEVSGFVQNHPMVLNGKYAQVIFREYVDSATEFTSVADTTGGEFASQ